MPSDLDRTEELWLWFEQEVHMLREYGLFFLTVGGSSSSKPNYLFLDQNLPALLIIKGVGILDHLISSHLSTELDGDASIPSRLHGKIEKLRQMGSITIADDLLAIKDRRNELAHEPNVSSSWEELDQCLGKLRAGLRELSLIGEIPQYEVKGTVRRLPDSEADPMALLHQKITFGLYDDKEAIIELSFDKKSMRRANDRPSPQSSCSP